MKELLITIFFISVLIMISFALGRRWESYCIKNQLENSTVAISKWGDNSWITINGTVRAYNKTLNSD